jgi:uncharacterized protein (TIGR02246 family)
MLVQRRWFLSHGAGIALWHFRGPLMGSPQSIQAIIDRARQAWLDGDAQSFAQLFSPTGEMIVPGQRWCGPAAILAAFQAYAEHYQVTTIAVHNLVIQGNRAMVEWTWKDQDKRTGFRSTAEDAIAVDIQDGQIQRWREYIDDTTP